MENKIVAIGEVLIDLTQIGKNELGIPQFAANPGGAPANVAVAAARLGADTGFIGRVGQDAFGAQLRQVLVENNVDVAGLSEDPEVPTTLAVVSVAPSGERSFAFYRNPGADLMLKRVDNAILQQAKWLHFGSVSLTADPSRTAVLGAALSARQFGAFISYDPNYRGSLWNSEETAKHWMRAPLDFVDVVKISDEETALLTDAESPEEASRIICGKGAKLVLVTLGANGVYYRMGDMTGTVPGFKVKVADTNGAGDTFFGAFLSQLAQLDDWQSVSQDELEAMLRFANRAASLTTSRPGAIPAMPTLKEVQEALNNG